MLQLHVHPLPQIETESTGADLLGISAEGTECVMTPHTGAKLNDKWGAYSLTNVNITTKLSFTCNVTNSTALPKAIEVSAVLSKALSECRQGAAACTSVPKPAQSCLRAVTTCPSQLTPGPCKCPSQTLHISLLPRTSGTRHLQTHRHRSYSQPTHSPPPLPPGCDDSKNVSLTLVKAAAAAVVPYTYNVTFDMDFDTIVSSVVDGEPVLTETGKVFKMNVRSKVAAAVGLPIGNVQVRCQDVHAERRLLAASLLTAACSRPAAPPTEQIPKTSPAPSPFRSRAS